MQKTSPFHSTLWLSLEKLLSMALVLFTTLILARYLTPTLFGQLNYLIALVSLLAPFAAMGLNAIVTRELVQQPEKKNEILGSALTLRLCGALLSTLLAVLLSYLFVDDALQGVFIVLLLANVFTAFLVFDYWLQAHVANQYAAKARFSILCLITLARLAAVYFEASFSIFVYLAALELTFTGLIFIVIYCVKGDRLSQLSFSWCYAKHLLSQSWWLMLSGIAAIVYLKIDQVMLGQLSTHEQVGIYAVAARLSEVWYFFPVALVSSYFPKLLHSKKQSQQQYQANLQKLNDCLYCLALIIAIVIMFIGKPIVILLFGEEYQASALVLQIHIWAGVFIFMRALLSKWILAENLVRFSLITQLIGAVLNIIANGLLIPTYGAIGAAVATVLSYAAASYFALFLHTKTWPMAKVMSYSFLLPLRVLCKGKHLYT